MFRLFKQKGIERDVTVIIRSVGERTEAACQQLLTSQIRERNVHLIHETPFSQALKTSYQIGINSRRKWTLVVDADVLVRANIIEELYQRAEAAPKSVFAVQSEMLDKFFGGIRVGGMKMYRTAYLPKALKLVPDVNIRPEATVIKTMHKDGYYVDISDLVCGMHDFEQSYPDIFRKGFAHGIKHAVLADVIMPYWVRMQKKDADFKVLLAGYRLGLAHTGELKLDKDEVLAEYKKFARASTLKAKSKAYTAALTPEKISERIATYKSPKEYKHVMAEIVKMGRPEIPNNAE